MSKRITFSPSEKMCLQELIVKYKINSAATGFAYNNKKIAWQNLTEEFNSIGTNIQRTEAQLKKCYDNLKTRRKGELTEEKRERMRTGGGSYPPSTVFEEQPTETVDEALLDITNIELQYTQDSDSDAITLDINYPKSSAPPVPAPAASTSLMGSQRLDPPPIAETVEEPLQVSQTHGITDSPLCRACMEREETAAHVFTDCPEVAEYRATYLGQPRSLPEVFGDIKSLVGFLEKLVTRNVRAHVINEEFKIRKEKYGTKQEMEEELHKLKVKEREWLVKSAEEQYERSRLERLYAELVLKRALEKKD